MLHSKIVLGDIHKIHNFEFLNEAERLSAVVTSADVGKVAWQKDNDSFWFLKSFSPLTWVGMGSGTTGGGNLSDKFVDSPTIQYGTQSPILVGSYTTGKRILSVIVQISEPFDALDASVTLGTDSQPDLLVNSSDIDIHQAGTYVVTPIHVFANLTDVKAFVTPGTLATSGEVFFSIQTGG